MELCEVQGNPDMYGIGIRIGFYLQWAAGILSTFLHVPDELSSINLGLASFRLATFLALVIMTAWGTASAVDMYITLLLCFGYYYFLIPLFAWRALSGFDVRYDPTRLAIQRPRLGFEVVNHLLVLAVLGYQLWFWIAAVPKAPFYDCVSYGFLFSRIALEDYAFQCLNIALSCIMIAIFLNSLVRTLIAESQKSRGGGASPDGSDDDAAQPGESGSPPFTQLIPLGPRMLRLAISSAVVITLITASELTIVWNGLSGVNDLASAGQMIPLIIGAAILLHVVYVKTFYGPENVDFRYFIREPWRAGFAASEASSSITSDEG